MLPNIEKMKTEMRILFIVDRLAIIDEMLADQIVSGPYVGRYVVHGEQRALLEAEDRALRTRLEQLNESLGTII